MQLQLEQVRTIAAFATLAPSVHNTQPWQFVGNGPTLEVRAEAERRLEFLDPSSRQLHVSCGAAIEFARLAIRALGFDAVVRLMPRPEADPDLLATLTLGHRLPTTAVEQRLIDAIPRRYTDRGPYDDRPVPSDVIARAADAAADRGCWMRVLDRPGDRVTIATLLSDAEAAEVADPRYHEELAKWRHESSCTDGIPDAALPSWAGEQVSDVPLRDFTGGGAQREPGADLPPHVERDTVVLLGSDDDTSVAWLRTGRALALVLLTLTDAGVVTQPLGPITDVPSTRWRLRQELGLLGRPQLLLRAGYGHGAPRTGRREVDTILSMHPVA